MYYLSTILAGGGGHSTGVVDRSGQTRRHSSGCERGPVLRRPRVGRGGGLRLHLSGRDAGISHGYVTNWIYDG